MASIRPGLPRPAGRPLADRHRPHASDIAFLANHGGDISMSGLSVHATIDGPLPMGDIGRPIAIR
ncbi:hypothetical protein JMUB6875_48670 [Nocardia sp. JMUB6875]